MTYVLILGLRENWGEGGGGIQQWDRTLRDFSEYSFASSIKCSVAIMCIFHTSASLVASHIRVQLDQLVLYGGQTIAFRGPEVGQ